MELVLETFGPSCLLFGGVITLMIITWLVWKAGHRDGYDKGVNDGYRLGLARKDSDRRENS